MCKRRHLWQNLKNNLPLTLELRTVLNAYTKNSANNCYRTADRCSLQYPCIAGKIAQKLSTGPLQCSQLSFAASLLSGDLLEELTLSDNLIFIVYAPEQRAPSAIKSLRSLTCELYLKLPKPVRQSLHLSNESLNLVYYEMQKAKYDRATSGYRTRLANARTDSQFRKASLRLDKHLKAEPPYPLLPEDTMLDKAASVM